MGESVSFVWPSLPTIQASTQAGRSNLERLGEQEEGVIASLCAVL